MSYKECIKEEIDILEYKKFYKATTKNHKLRCLYNHKLEKRILREINDLFI